MLREARRHGVRCLAAVVALYAAGAVRAAGPEILKQVPGDAYGVIVVGNVRTLASKISSAAAVMHLASAVPPDPISAATRTLGITSGFDQNGSAALVLLKPEGDRAGGDYFSGTPPLVLLVPTTNPTLMLEKFNPTDPDKDGIMGITAPDNPDEKGFAALVEKKWVALALKRQDIATYVARGAGKSFADTVSPETLKTFDTNDVVLWGNVQKLGTGAEKWLDDQQVDAGGMRDLQNFVHGADPLQSALEKHSMGVAFSIAKEFFRDAGGSMMTVRLTDSGATLGLIAEFKPDTPLGKFVAAQQNAGPVSLKGLPAGNFLVAGAGAWNGQSMAGALRNFLNQITDDPALAKDPRLDDLRKMTDAAAQVTQMTGGMRFSVLEPAARGKDGGFSGAFIVDATDPKKFIELETQLADSPLTRQGMNADIKQTVTVTPNAVSVKGVALTRMNVKLALREETADNPIPAASKAAYDAAQKLYGPDGLTVHMGAVGKHVLLIYGSSISVTDMEGMVTAAAGDSDALSAMPAIAATKDQLVANPVAVAYLPIARWVGLAPALMGLGDGGGNMPAAASNAPPVVVSMGISGTMVTTEIHVPLATITATQDAVHKLQGGPGDGPGGGILPNLP